jgi:hypothetical protein
VVTLPLGVLKSSSVQFVPALPAHKTNAISRLQMGLLNKVRCSGGPLGGGGVGGPALPAPASASLCAPSVLVHGSSRLLATLPLQQPRLPPALHMIVIAHITVS